MLNRNFQKKLINIRFERKGENFKILESVKAILIIIKVYVQKLQLINKKNNQNYFNEKIKQFKIWKKA